MQQALVEDISTLLAPGGQVSIERRRLSNALSYTHVYEMLLRQLLVASDVEEVATDMTGCVEMHSSHSLQCSPGEGVDSEGWMCTNPLGVPTEREAAVIMQNGKMYRALYVKS